MSEPLRQAQGELHGREYFDYYVNVRKWNPTIKGQWQANYAAMIERVFGLAAKGLRVLDVGCAAGSQASAMRDLGVDVWGVERDRYFVEVSPFVNMRGRILHAPAQAIPFRDASFDFIHCSQVLEHIPEDEVRLALAEIARVAKPCAKFFATLPVDKGEPQPEDDDVTHRTVKPMDWWREQLMFCSWAAERSWHLASSERFEAEPMQRQYGWDYFIAMRREER